MVGFLLILLGIAALVSTVHGLWHQYRCPACRVARQAMRERHPDWRISDAWHRASEPTRDVVAVFYELPRMVHFPTLYRLVVVNHDGVIEELPDDMDSPYMIRGRK